MLQFASTRRSKLSAPFWIHAFAGCVVAVTHAALTCVADDPRGNSNISADTVARRVTAICDLVLDRHIDPPARQTMLLAGAKALYERAEQPVPPGLS
jgi:hypothetical protein